MAEDQLFNTIEQYKDLLKEIDKIGVYGKSLMFLDEAENEDGLVDILNELIQSRLDYLTDIARQRGVPEPFVKRAFDLESGLKALEELYYEAKRILG